MAKKVLVIEDESSIREMLCFVLEQQGYQTIEAEDYNSGIQLVNEEIPDLILLDWMLPGGTGINLLKYIKKNENVRNIPVVMLTARSEESDKIKGLETIQERIHFLLGLRKSVSRSCQVLKSRKSPIF